MLDADWGPIYRLGRVVLTPNARACVSNDDVATALLHHLQKSWGERAGCRSPRTATPVLDGCRVLSVSRAGNGTWFWIITEADHTQTRVLLPEEY